MKNKGKFILISILISLLGVVLMLASTSFIWLGAKMIGKSVALGVVLIVASSLLTLVLLHITVLCVVVTIKSGALCKKTENIAKANSEQVIVEEVLKCESCGAGIKANDKFCSQCGEKVK